jgi:hypothetical protein
LRPRLAAGFTFLAALLVRPPAIIVASSVARRHKA